MKTSAPLPEKIGRYQILECVGRGGMGVLYRGFDAVLDREVAVKVMLADFSHDADQMRPRFYREAKAAAKLQHRNIVTVFEFAEEANQPHIVMEFLRGTQLGTRMLVSPPLTLDDKLDIVAQLCAGLGYAHSQGVVHRDVKPANVFLLDDGTVKLLDFGIARLSTSTLTQHGDVLGSAPYMSPEQVSGTQSVDGRSDVWSTGVLLFEMLTGRKPFAGDTLTSVIVGILKDEPPSLDALVPGLPQRLMDTVARALEKDPALRFQKAEELGRELQLIRKTPWTSGDLPPMDATRYASTNVLKALHADRQTQSTAAVSDRTLEGLPAPPAVAALPRSRNPMLLGGAAAALVAAIGVGAWLGSSSSANRQDNAPEPTSAGAPAASAPAQVQSPPSPPPAASNPSPGATPSAAEKKPNVVLTGGRQSGSARVSGALPSGDGGRATPAAPSPSAAPASVVAVSMSAAFPFAVMDGARVLSPAATTHELPPQPGGKMLRLVAPEVFLDHTVRVEGTGGRFEYSPPGLGRLDIRAVRGDCRIMVGKRDLGFGPLEPFRAAPGEYQVRLACPDGTNPMMQITVTEGLTARVYFKG